MVARERCRPKGVEMQCFNVAKTIATSFPGFSSSRPYGARGRDTLVGSGHVAPEQN